MRLVCVLENNIIRFFTQDSIKSAFGEKKINKLDNYHDYRWWTKVLVTLTVFAKLFLENF